jgi:Zn-dependent membrane protease YugP
MLGFIVAAFSSYVAGWMFMIAAILISVFVFATLVTLPVEFDASNRAKALVVEKGIVGIDERRGMDKVLNAAAMTYVAAVASSLATLLYFLIRSGLLGGRRD